MTRRPLARARAPLFLGAVALLVLALAACGGGADGKQGERYHCPMHPTIVSERPGDCPICGMRLVPIEKDAGPAGASPGAVQTRYVCPMHPEITAANPDERCPLCGMRLEPVQHTDTHAAAPASGQLPPGYAQVELHAEEIRLAGVRSAPAVREVIGRPVRAVGTVRADERRVHHMHTKFSGWVEKLYVNFVGQSVRRGEPILTVYSPELLATQEDFLRARDAAARFASSTLPEVREGADDLLRAARRRLELLDVPPSAIAELEQTGKPLRGITLFAPHSGVALGKDVFEGQQVEPGMELFTITDLSHLWVEADVYQDEAGSVRVGQPAAITPPSGAGPTLRGRVDFINPFVSPETRTLRVRFDFDNPGLSLKPDMFVNVEMTLRAAPALTIPDNAVIDTGVRQVVFVDRGGGVFVPREVRVGTRSDGRAEVLSGLAEGEHVATRANFLLDSESRLRAALAATSPPAAAGAASGHEGHGR